MYFKAACVYVVLSTMHYPVYIKKRLLRQFVTVLVIVLKYWHVSGLSKWGAEFVYAIALSEWIFNTHCLTQAGSDAQVQWHVSSKSAESLERVEFAKRPSTVSCFWNVFEGSVSRYASFASSYVCVSCCLEYFFYVRPWVNLVLRRRGYYYLVKEPNNKLPSA